jgi:hypothetical protein
LLDASYSDPVPSRLQSKIILALYRAPSSESDFVDTDSVLRLTGISPSTWAEEQVKLADMKLIEKQKVKAMKDDRIVSIARFRLTGRGILVAAKLADVSRIISGIRNLDSQNDKMPQMSANDSASYGSLQSDISDDVCQRVLDCVDAALEGFGLNFSRFTHTNLSIVEGLQKNDIIRKPDLFMHAMRRLYGREGARSLELLILENLRSEFGEELRRAHSFASAINQIMEAAIREPREVVGAEERQDMDQLEQSTKEKRSN